jgi:hypothetical protein
MSYVRRIVAFVSGIVLIPATVFAAFYLFVGLVPNQFYNYFERSPVGRDELHRLLASATFNAATVVLPCFLGSLAGSWASLRWLARPPRVAVWWCFAGLIVGVMCLELAGAVRDHYVCLDTSRQHPEWFRSGYWDCSVLSYLRFRLIASQSLVATTLSLISGLAAAAALVLRSERLARPSYA